MAPHQIQPASPLPWRIEERADDTYVYDASGKAISCDMRYYPWTPNPDDWRYIVTACNLFPEMLEALKAVVENRGCGDPDCCQGAIDAEAAVMHAKSILAKAEGRE